MSVDIWESSPGRPDLRPASQRPTRRFGVFHRIGNRPVFSVSVLALFAITGAIGPLLVPYSPTQIDLPDTLAPPVFAGGTWSHPLGTDQLGRDMLSRLVGGARISLLVGLAVVVLSGAIGVFIGIISGYLGGRVDAALMRFTDAALAFPVLLLALVLVGVYGPSTTNVIIVLVIAFWANYARIIRSEVTALKTQEFVGMSRVLGAGPGWIMRRHILPNVVSSLLVLATLQLGLAVITEGALSFLGLGVPPPAPTWGGMLAEGRNLLAVAWWVPVLPGVALSMTVLATNLTGDWLRSHFDPTSRQ